MDQAEAHFDLLGNSLNLGAISGLGLRQMYHDNGNRFGHSQLYSWVMYVKWKLILTSLEIVLVSTQDSCTVCAERTIGLKIILDAPDGTPR
jgi:hypothetical protein